MADGIIDESWYVRPEGIEEHTCAGGLVARRVGNQILVALGYQTGYHDRILPKGHVEPNETIEAAARREIEEEAGFSHLSLLCKLGMRDRLDFRKQAWKQTYYFLFLTDQIEAFPSHGHHHSPPSWHDLDQLPPLFWPEQQELVDSNRERIREAVLAASA